VDTLFIVVYFINLIIVDLYILVNDSVDIPCMIYHYPIYYYYGDYMNQLWLDTTYQLVDEIKNENAYKRLLDLKQIIATDTGLQHLISEFQTANKKYEETRKYGKHHPDLKRVQASFAKHKKILYTHPVVSEYKQLEKLVQSNLDIISKTIATSISSKMKHPNDIGIIPKH